LKEKSHVIEYLAPPILNSSKCYNSQRRTIQICGVSALCYMMRINIRMHWGEIEGPPTTRVYYISWWTKDEYDG